MASKEGSSSIDFFTYLIGKWKRNLEWREFGGICMLKFLLILFVYEFMKFAKSEF